MSRHNRDHRLRPPALSHRRHPHPRLEPDHSSRQIRPCAPAAPWPLHRLLDIGGNWRLFVAAPEPRVEVEREAKPDPGRDTRALVAYGVRLGLGKAAQTQVLRRLREQLSGHAALLDDPRVLAGVRLALPLLGLQLAERLRDERLAAQLRELSQGMLLVNTIDLTADAAGVLAQQVAELARLALSLYGIEGEDATAGVAQLTAGIGIDEPLSALPAPDIAARVLRDVGEL